MSTSVASVTKHFPSAENGFTTTTSGSISSGAATVGLNSVAGYANGEVAVFIIDPDNSKKQAFTGTIDTSGVQVTGVVWTAGTNVAHDAGATVVDYASATHISMISKGILVEHNQDGTHDEATIISRTEDTSPATGDFILTSDVSDTNALKKVQLGNFTLFTLKKNILTTDSNPYKFRVSQNGAANSGNGAFATIAFDTEQYDTNSNVAAGVYTVPVSGFYHFSWRASVTTSGAEDVIASLFVNGVRRADGNEATLTTLPIGSSGSDNVQLTAGDTVDIRVFCTATRALNVGTTYQNYFSGHLVCRT